MELMSNSIDHGETIGDEYALAVPHDEDRVTFSGNRNPHLAWSGVPDGTRSFVVTCIDRDVPTKPDDVNKEDREVPPDLPRTDFVHWIAVDLPHDLREIEAGEFSTQVSPGGKDSVEGPYGCRQGVNDYTSWFEGDSDMEGTYLGYDGPAPPWNDSLVHHYDFTVHALDVDRLPLLAPFTVDDVNRAMKGHVLDSATITGTYTLNPRLR